MEMAMLHEAPLLRHFLAIAAEGSISAAAPTTTFLIIVVLLWDIR